MSNLYGVIGESKPRYLLARPGGEMISIPCKPNEGEIAAGTLVYRGADGMYAAADVEKAVTTEYLAVLGETVDTSANVEIAEDAPAYISGCFIDGKVTLKGGSPLTDEVKVVLRKQNITFLPDGKSADV